MTDYCFALKNGFCEAMKEPRCPGYDVCPFYKKKSENDEELLRYNGTRDMKKICLDRLRMSGREQEEIMAMRQEGMNARQIGEMLGISERTITGFLVRARRTG